jgi:hypothetical protein
MTQSDLSELRFYSVAAVAVHDIEDQARPAIAAITFVVEATDIGTAEEAAIDRVKQEFPKSHACWAELALIKPETILHMAEVIKCQT